jgi:Aspartyl protease
MRPVAFVSFNTKLGKPAPVTIRALLDSGASELLINAKHVKHLRVKKASKSSTGWSTPTGEMKTLSRVKAQFTIPKLQEKKLLEWNLHVAENMGAYDMIIGRDIMNFLGINIQFSDSTVHWENASMQFKPVDAMIDTDYHIAESMAVEDTTEQIRKILDAKYQATNLEKVCLAQSHLKYQQQRKLFDLLSKFSNLFNGTLGKWNQDPIKLELKEGATPYNAQPFPIPKCHAENPQDVG